LDNVQNFCQVGSIHGHIRPLKKDYILLISDKGETYFTVQLHYIEDYSINLRFGQTLIYGRKNLPFVSYFGQTA